MKLEIADGPFSAQVWPQINIFCTPMIFLLNLAFSVLLPLQNLLFKNLFTVILESNRPEFVVIKLSQGGERIVGVLPIKACTALSERGAFLWCQVQKLL